MSEDETAHTSPSADLAAFLDARLREDEAIARDATRKRYPRWRIWLRRLFRG